VFRLAILCFVATALDAYVLKLVVNDICLVYWSADVPADVTRCVLIQPPPRHRCVPALTSHPPLALSQSGYGVAKFTFVSSHL
jgi:hypothetical protein